jgi:AcrR family transcriptional regulator
MTPRKVGSVSEETRRRLVESAAEVFGRRGYDGTTVAEIARNAGLTSGAIYAHYQNKSDLLMSTIERVDGDETAVLGEAEALAGDGDAAGEEEVGVAGRRIRRGRVDPAALLDLFERVGTRLGGRSRGRFDGSILLEAVVAARRNPEVALATRARISRRERRIAELLRLAQARGTCDPDLSADAIARYTTALTLGLVMVRSLELDPPDPGTWAHLVGRTVDALRPADRPGTDEPTDATA